MRYTIKRIMAKLKSWCVQIYCLKPYTWMKKSLVSLPVLSTLSALTPSSKNLLQMGGPIQFQAQHEVRNTYEYDLQWQTIYFFVKGTWNLLVNRYLIFETHLFLQNIRISTFSSWVDISMLVLYYTSRQLVRHNTRLCKSSLNI